MEMIGFNLILLALILMTGTLVYLFGETDNEKEAEQGRERQRVRILVKNGYQPALIRLRAGTPAILEFYRAEEDPCSERLIIDGFNRSIFLPPYAATRIELMPEEPGEYEFACGMGKIKGVIRVIGI